MTRLLIGPTKTTEDRWYWLSKIVGHTEPYRMESFAPSSGTCPQEGSCCGASHEVTPERFKPSAAGYTSKH